MSHEQAPFLLEFQPLPDLKSKLLDFLIQLNFLFFVVDWFDMPVGVDSLFSPVYSWEPILTSTTSYFCDSQA